VPAIKTSVGEYDVREATPAEGRELFDSRARALLGISGEEFLQRWDNGDYQETDDPNVSALAVLMPFAR
jgi:hypothetical protein